MEELTTRERFSRVLRFQPVDRLPVIEFSGWWNKTLERWRREGLPADLDSPGLKWYSSDIKSYLGLDKHLQYWISTRWEREIPKVAKAEDYERIKKNLYCPNFILDKALIKSWAEQQRRGEVAVWITLDGFFWFPRELLGIERHLYAFYDTPELMHRINVDLLEFNLQMLNDFCSICVPDFIVFAEDMSYNHGPMISREIFNKFIAPYYKKIVPKIKEYDIIPIIDSDGDIKQAITWFMDVGVDGFSPLERQAGVDINELRSLYPQARFFGGYNKMVLNRTEKEMRAEFERIFPTMKSGGYIPSVDHQTPPGVSLANYRTYVQLLKEYCIKAGSI